jgi:hypothetical protein
MVNVRVRVSSFGVIVMKGARGMSIFPNGPSTSTLLHEAWEPFRPRAFDDDGELIVKVTSGGIVIGIAPILDRHWGEVENRLDCAGRVNAGTRKAGKVTSRTRPSPKMTLNEPHDWAQRRRDISMMFAGHDDDYSLQYKQVVLMNPNEIRGLSRGSDFLSNSSRSFAVTKGIVSSQHPHPLE